MKQHKRSKQDTSCLSYSKSSGKHVSDAPSRWKSNTNKIKICVFFFLCLCMFVLVIVLRLSRKEVAMLRRYRLLQLSFSLDQSGGNEDFDHKVIALVAVGVLYMFVAIAIVCDEFFVPALEEIASDNYLNLSMDVAGATLMAAGGSAPELFTSLIGAFRGSEIGFGTIVGSAVFNVLFVIGMCALCSKNALSLTWWPLFRDCIYYAMTLGILALFCGYSSPNEIEMWEALIMFALYAGYVTVMKFNADIHTKMIRGIQQSKIADETACAGTRLVHGCCKPNTFRARLLNFLMGKGSLVDKVGFAIVTKISGDVYSVFRKVDRSGDGYIDRDEFKTMMDMLEAEISEEDLNRALDDQYNIIFAFRLILRNSQNGTLHQKVD